MAISLAEEIISLPVATRELPNRPHASTMWRYAKRGDLETIRIGGRVFTSREAVRRMLAAMNGASLAPDRSPGKTDKRRREIDAARSRVKARGIA